MNSTTQCVAFDGTLKIASGELRSVALQVQKHGSPSTLLFDDSTSQLIDLDLSGSVDELMRQLDALAPPPAASEEAVAPEAPRSPGRPKLGVVAREVTLLPRHWEWLNQQPGGASVALRKLIDEARRLRRDEDRLREARESAYRFMSALAGNETGFEEALRSLFSGDAARFAEHISTWPTDVRQHTARLAARAFERNENPT